MRGGYKDGEVEESSDLLTEVLGRKCAYLELIQGTQEKLEEKRTIDLGVP